jgi:hypothetical protein
MEHILKLFADASGLNTNLSKTQFCPIQCQDTDLGFLARMDQPVHTFPCTYLGLPLNTRRLTRSSLQPLIQKIGGRLLGWKKKLYDIFWEGASSQICAVYYAHSLYYSPQTP